MVWIPPFAIDKAGSNAPPRLTNLLTTVENSLLGLLRKLSASDATSCTVSHALLKKLEAPLNKFPKLNVGMLKSKLPKLNLGILKLKLNLKPFKKSLPKIPLAYLGKPNRFAVRLPSNTCVPLGKLTSIFLCLGKSPVCPLGSLYAS